MTPRRKIIVDLEEAVQLVLYIIHAGGTPRTRLYEMFKEKGIDHETLSNDDFEKEVENLTDRQIETILMSI